MLCQARQGYRSVVFPDIPDNHRQCRFAHTDAAHVFHLLLMSLQGPAEQKHHIALHHQVSSGLLILSLQKALLTHLQDNSSQPLIPAAAHHQYLAAPLAVKHLPEKIRNTVIFQQQTVKGLPESTSLKYYIDSHRILFPRKNRLVHLRRNNHKISLLQQALSVLRFPLGKKTTPAL